MSAMILACRLCRLAPPRPLHRALAAPTAAPTYYEELGVHPQARPREIKAAFYALSKEYHPDKNVADEEALRRFQAISEAWEVLGNPATRERYDKGVLGRASSVAERAAASHTFEGEAFYEGRAGAKAQEQRRKQMDQWVVRNRTEEFEYKMHRRRVEGGAGNTATKSLYKRDSVRNMNKDTDAGIGKVLALIILVIAIFIGILR